MGSPSATECSGDEVTRNLCSVSLCLCAPIDLANAIDDASVAGSVMHIGTDTELGTLTFNGSFVVTRCP